MNMWMSPPCLSEFISFSSNSTHPGDSKPFLPTLHLKLLAFHLRPYSLSSHRQNKTTASPTSSARLALNPHHCGYVIPTAELITVMLSGPPSFPWPAALVNLSSFLPSWSIFYTCLLKYHFLCLSLFPPGLLFKSTTSISPSLPPLPPCAGIPQPHGSKHYPHANGRYLLTL